MPRDLFVPRCENLSEPGATLVSFASGRTVSNPSRSPAVSPRKGLGAFVHRQKDLDAYLKGLERTGTLRILPTARERSCLSATGVSRPWRGGGQITLGYDEMDAKLEVLITVASGEMLLLSAIPNGGLILVKASDGKYSLVQVLARDSKLLRVRWFRQTDGTARFPLVPNEGVAPMDSASRSSTSALSE